MDLIDASFDLILNLTLLVSLTILTGFVDKRLKRTTLQGALAQGVLFGLTAVIGMARPLILGPGLIFDGRSVMISLCALYFGPIAVSISAAIAIVYRLLLGGSGMLMGVLVILSAAGIGVFARSRLSPDERPPTPRQLYALGLIVHTVMLGLTMTLPGGLGPFVRLRLGASIIILFPLATVLAGKLLSDQVEAQRSLAALRESEERFKLSMEATNDGLWDLDVPTDKAYYNPAYFRNLGYDPGEFPALGATWLSLVHSDDRERVLSENRACIEGVQDSIDTEFRMRSKQGDWRWIYSRGKCISRDTGGRALRLLGTHVDITERKRVEAEIKRSLEEKEILLQEVHHRVKNNLNLISSLLSLQSSRLDSPEQALAAFENSQERILALSLVHEELYRSRDYSHVNMSEYVENLLSQLTVAYGQGRRIGLTFGIEDLELDVSTAIPCGLILNELITNAFKHAFPEDRAGSVHIELRRAADEMVEMTVADDGTGVSADLVTAANDSLGLTLVRLLVGQLHGTLRVEAELGTRFEIRFPLNRHFARADSLKQTPV